MTRINVVSVKDLTNKHLFAEYRELPRIFTAVGKLAPGEGFLDGGYRLGQGHVKFFYNKLTWLLDRYKQLKGELDGRNYNINLETYDSIVSNAERLIEERKGWDVVYNPTPDEKYTNMQRLVERWTK